MARHRGVVGMKEIGLGPEEAEELGFTDGDILVEVIMGPGAVLPDSDLVLPVVDIMKGWFYAYIECDGKGRIAAQVKLHNWIDELRKAGDIVTFFRALPAQAVGRVTITETT